MTRDSRWSWDPRTDPFATFEMSRPVTIPPVAAIGQHDPYLQVRVNATINQGIFERERKSMRFCL